MNKSMTPRIIFILVLAGLAGWTLVPPSKTLRQGIDLAGGTQMVFEIDSQGLTPDEEKGLSAKMITVLRRRVDPANIQNLVWRPQGNTRFEIQMPLASKETQVKREAFNLAREALIDQNVNPATILRALQSEPSKRVEYFNQLAGQDPNRMSILEDLAKIYDERSAMQAQRDQANTEMAQQESVLEENGIVDLIKNMRTQWATLDDAALAERMKSFPGLDKDPNTVKAYLTSYRLWAEAVDPLTDATDGLNQKYQQAVRELDRFNLTDDQLNATLDMPAGSLQRDDGVIALKTEFPDRNDTIDAVLVAYDAYSPFKGQLDSPEDLIRMLRGAGILEFRILPTTDRADLTPEDIKFYIEQLKSKGPKHASTEKYGWFQIENLEEWSVRTSVVGEFGGKYYALASNQLQESMVHNPGKKEWALQRANASQDQMGRRAIAFLLDDKGGILFAKLTGNNVNRPLCIMLDDMAISAPNISTQIFRNGIITGSYTEIQVSDMVNKLNAGSLPARLIEQPISTKTIGPAIGADNRDKGVRAGIIGLVAVLVCMILYYLKAGAVADVALLLNILFVLATMAGLRATFTLPGIAGIILTIGMSVDANVLIFERIREEQAKGSALGVAIKNGYQRAFRAIFDANLTTFITAAILYWVATEEIKGFAIVLMLGILSSMFSALYVTRVIFEILTRKGIITDQIKMMRLIGETKINWMGMRPIFLTVSTILVVGGLTLFFTRDDTKNNRFDIEFTGGTQAQVHFKEGVEITRQQVQDRLKAVAVGISKELEAATVTTIGDPNDRQFEVTTTETNKTTATVTFTGEGQTEQTVTAAIREADAKVSGNLSRLRIVPGDTAKTFVVSTSQINKNLVRNLLETAFPEATVSEPESDEIVTSTIMEAFAGELAVRQNLEPSITSADKVTEMAVDGNPLLADALGGIMIRVKIGQAASLEDIDQRLRDLIFKPDTQDLTSYPYQLFNADVMSINQDQPAHEFVYVSVHPEAGLRELNADEWKLFEDNETQRITEATSIKGSLPRVTQIDPSVGGEQTTRALIAIVLSLCAIVAYVWIRFGNVRYGVAAIAALVHDVAITLGAVSLCGYIYDMSIGELLLIGNFKINLAMIAAFLTLIGYSLNDTIVVFDRIRENRTKAQMTPQTITKSINQMISRTLLTSITTFVVVLIMYIFGGSGLRDFTFAIGFGVIVGTYSSIAIAAPILLIGMKNKKS